METIAKLSTDILEQLEITNATFERLLRVHEAEILATKRKTYKYGATDRHHLDVYFPAHAKTPSVPTLLFVYGGGFNAGDKVQDPPMELCYKNVGTFFTNQGFAVVIADYRIYPNAKHPDPSIDIRDAAAWVVAHADEINKDEPVKLDVSKFFLLGHSAGATIVTTLFLEPGLLPPKSDLHSRIVGIIPMAGVYHFRNVNAINPDVVDFYYGPSEEERRKKEGLGLLENASPELLSALPPVLATVSEFEDPKVAVTHWDFLKVLKEKVPGKVDDFVMKGQNHVSVMDTLMSGEGEDWAYKVVDWMQSKLQ